MGGVLRPSVDDYYLPEELEEILTKAWHPDVAQRSTMNDVCDQMQAFLMQIDIAYYEQNEGEFLFDVHLDQPSTVEADVEDLCGDEDWECMGGHAENFLLRPTAVGNTDIDGNSAEEDAEMITSFKSVETAGTKGPGAPEKACKVISRAA